MNNEFSQTLDELKSLGGQDTIDPFAGTSLMFNLRQTNQTVYGFHPKHGRTVPKVHLLSENTGEEHALVSVGVEEYAQASARMTEVPDVSREIDFVSEQKSHELPEPVLEGAKCVTTNRNSLEKSSDSFSGTAFAPSRSNSSLSQLTPGKSFVRMVSGRNYDPFSSPRGFILPPSESPDEPAGWDADDDVSKKVRMQYEKLPYPFRDPEEDKKSLTMPLLDNLMIVNQRCYQGKKNFHDEFRMLVAGGGTGDALTYLAVQTAWLPDAKIVYVDLSTESMKIAKERLHNQAERLNHANIENIVEFHQGSLLDVEKMGLGKFDYINCSGVLHHLENPNEGLAALRGVLKDNGAMSIMVYGQVGRTTIYQIQELMRIVNRNVDDADEKIKNTNLFLQYLPSSNLHRLSRRWGANESNPAEIYDLFLHSQDRAYTIDQLYDWVEGCGMSITAFSSGQQSFLVPELYPDTLSHKIRERIKEMSPREQRVFSELFYGHINKFEFHITPQSPSGSGTGGIDWLDLDLIPCYSLLARQQNMPGRLVETEESASLFHIPNHLDRLSFTVQSSPFARNVYRRIDDVTTIGEIFQKVQTLYPQMSDEVIHREILKNLKQLVQFDIVHIRHKSCRCELLNRNLF
ncbi:MAG: class I SAM-dependent methyltransferase [Planctomycetaceae bacterium]|nr:class I SAM-dependent methyltransferase [Planctomycetaceae bacterium]